MRALIVLLIFILPALGLRADEPTEGEASEAVRADANEASASEQSPAPAPVEASNPDDSFLPTDQLRYDQEVDYPTDI